VIPHLLKVEGSGNDFLLGTGAWADRLGSEPELVRRLCSRRRGIGADGTLALTVVSERTARIVYRNADGGEARFCANGTRCAARAAVDLLGVAPSLTVRTAWTDIPAVVERDTVSLELPPATAAGGQSHVQASPPLGTVSSVEVGVPHLVVESRAPLGELDLNLLAPPLRAHPALGPEGANVNIFSSADDGVVEVRSWERGVEGETLSCGSGLVAVALVVMADRGLRTLRLRPASGDLLTVEARGEPPACAARLTGPARIVAEIRPAEELLADL
jgi:diaminopimelate epimerase